MAKSLKIFVFLLLLGFTSLFPGCAERSRLDQPYLILYAFVTEGELLAEQMTIDTTRNVLGRTVHIGVLSGKNIILAESGIGMTNAAMTVQKMIDLFSPRGVFFSGIAGAVDTSVDIGDIVICDRWITHDYGFYGADGFQPRGIKYRTEASDSSYRSEFFPVDRTFLETAKKLRDYEFSFEKIAERAPKLVVSGVGVSGNSFIDNYEKRLWLSQQFSALVVDMETAAVAQVCTINEIPFIAFRSASDLAGGSGSSTASVEIDRFFTVAAVNSSKVLMKFIEEI